MYVPFESLAPQSRIWVYFANRDFSDVVSIVEQGLNHLCREWLAHGAPLKASYQIRYNRFVILAVDPSFNEASGCSIDGSVHALQQLQQTSGVDFFDRTQLPVLVKGEIKVYPMTSIKSIIVENKLEPGTLIFNPVVVTKDDFENIWVTALEKSWLSKYLSN